MPGGYDGSIRVDTSIDSKNFNSGVNGIVNSLKGVAAAVGVAFGVSQIIAFGKESVDAASQMTNALTGLQSVLNAQGKSFSEAKTFIDSYIADGLIPATNAVATYKNLATRGYATDEIEKLMNVMKDSAAFNRQGAFSMGEAVQKASEGLRNENSLLTDSVGIQKNVAKMWEEYAKKIGKASTELTMAEKRQAEINGFMEESKYFMGDAQKVAGTYSGKMAALSASFLNFKVALGNAIIPVIASILPYVTQLVTWLTTLATTFGQVTAALFGQQQGGSGQAAKATEDAAAAQGDLADATKKTEKAAKGQLAAFDEINVLSKKTAETAEEPVAPATAAAAGGAAAAIIPPDILAQVEEFKTKFLELIEPLREPFEKLKTVAGELGGTIWDGLKWVWENILLPLGVWLLQTAAPVFLDLLSAGLGVLNGVILALQPLGLWLWNNLLQPLAAWTGQAILDALKWLTDRLNELAAWLAAHPTAFVDFFNGIVTALTPLATWVNDNVIKPITTAFDGLIQSLIPFIAWFEKDMWPRIQWVLGLIGTNFKIIFDTVVKILGDAIGAVAGIVAGLITILSGIITFITGVFSGNWKMAWEGLVKIYEGIMQVFQSVVKGVVNIVIDLINGMIQAVVAGINGAINALNSLSITVPDWVPVLGGQSWGLNIAPVTAPQIPRLATGAVVPAHSNMLAMVGEGSQPEIVSPEDTMRQIVREEIANSGVTIKFEGSLSELARVLRPAIEREGTRIGDNLIQGVTA